MAEIRYHERQRVTAAWVWVLVALIATPAWVVFAGSLLFGLDLGPDPPPRGLQVVLLAIFGAGFPALILSFRLDITVDDEALRFSMRPFMRRRVPRADIARAEAVRYHPLRDYLGWGIKWMPGRGWAFAVDGDRGVRVHLRSGRSFLLGSRRPEELAAAIGAAPAAFEQACRRRHPSRETMPPARRSALLRGILADRGATFAAMTATPLRGVLEIHPHASRSIKRARQVKESAPRSHWCERLRAFAKTQARTRRGNSTARAERPGARGHGRFCLTRPADRRLPGLRPELRRHPRRATPGVR